MRTSLILAVAALLVISAATSSVSTAANDPRQGAELNPKVEWEEGASVQQQTGSRSLAAFSRVPLGAAVDEEMLVSARSVDNATYQFDWGDGETTSTQFSVGRHSYESPGNYTITLTVTDDDGRVDSATRTVRIDNVTDRRVTRTDDSQPGTVDADDPSDGGRRYEPVSFKGTAGQIITVATDTDAPTRLSVRRTDGGRNQFVKSSGTPVQNPAIRRVEIPATGTYTVRIATEAGKLPMEYDLAVTELAADAGNESAADTPDLGRVSYGASVESTIGRDDPVTAEGTPIEGGSFRGSAGDRVAVSLANSDLSAATIAGPGLAPTAVRTGDDIKLPGNGTYSVIIRGPFDSDRLPTQYTLTLTRRSDSERLIVDADGRTGNYTSIRGALEAASGGATVEVRPGVYRERVQLPDEDVKLVAPKGATIAGNGDGVGVAVPPPETSNTERVVQGFTIEGHETGVGQATVIGPSDWQLRNVTIRNNTEFGVEATSGDWSIRDATITNNGRIGVDAIFEAGDWSIRDTNITNNGGSGIRAGSTSGDWTVADTYIAGNAGIAGISALEASGDWRMASVTVTDNNNTGVLAQRTTGDWSVQDATIARNGQDGVNALGANGAWAVNGTTVADNGQDGIVSVDTQGDWQLESVRIVDNGRAGVLAAGASDSWEIADTRVVGNGAVGINTNNAPGDWRITDSRIASNSIGVLASDADGDWRVAGSVVESNDRYGIDAIFTNGDWTVARSAIRDNGGPNVSREVAGIRATATASNWTVERSILTENERRDIYAVGSRSLGNASRNWWGQPGGARDEQCRGNVTCEDPLTDRPEIGVNPFPNATALNTGRTAAEIDEIDERDVYEASVDSGGRVNLTLTAAAGVGDLDLFVFDASGSLLAGSISLDGSENLSRVAIGTKTYFVAVDGAGDVTGEYTLRVEVDS